MAGKAWGLLLGLALGCAKEKYPAPGNPPAVAPPRAALVAAAGRFAVGQAVQTTPTVTNVRSSPWHGNTSSNVIGTVPRGTVGSVVDGPVIDTSSDGDRWGRWSVAFTAPLPSGWVADTYLVATTAPPPPPPPVPVVTTIAVTPPAVSLLVGVSAQLTATARDQTGAVMPGQVFAWTSGSGSIAVVSATGLVTGVAPGGATILASAGGKSGSAGVTVTALPPPPPPPPPGAGTATVTVVPIRTTLIAVQQQPLYAVVTRTDGSVIPVVPLKWFSSDSNVAAVDNVGQVSARRAGTATITAVDTSGVVGRATITVLAPMFLSVTKVRVANVPSRWLVSVPTVIPSFPALPIGTGLYALDLLTGDSTVVGHARCAVTP